MEEQLTFCFVDPCQNLTPWKKKYNGWCCALVGLTGQNGCGGYDTGHWCVFRAEYDWNGTLELKYWWNGADAGEEISITCTSLEDVDRTARRLLKERPVINYIRLER